MFLRRLPRDPPRVSRRQQLNALKVNENKVQCRHGPSDAVWRIHGRAAGERGVQEGQEGLGEGHGGGRRGGTATGSRTESVKSLQISAA